MATGRHRATTSVRRGARSAVRSVMVTSAGVVPTTAREIGAVLTGRAGVGATRAVIVVTTTGHPAVGRAHGSLARRPGAGAARPVGRAPGTRIDARVRIPAAPTVAVVAGRPRTTAAVPPKANGVVRRTGQAAAGSGPGARTEVTSATGRGIAATGKTDGRIRIVGGRTIGRGRTTDR
jgi:hypothetical protein